MQLINDFFSGSLQRIDGHVCVTHQINGKEQTRIVNSFHNYALQNIHEDFEVDFLANDGIIEAIHHKNKEIYAIMWHPEREKTFKNEDIELFQKVFQRKI